MVTATAGEEEEILFCHNSSTIKHDYMAFSLSLGLNLGFSLSRFYSETTFFVIIFKVQLLMSKFGALLSASNVTLYCCTCIVACEQIF